MDKNILVVIIVIILLPLSILYFPVYGAQVMNGLFILFSAILTAIFAIHQYQSEQRTSRIQKLYFEETLLGQAKSIEAMMSQTNTNMQIAENLINLTSNLLHQELGIEDKKLDILTSFNNSLRGIKVGVHTTDLKKEAISKMLNDSGEKNNFLPTWIKKFEDDTYRFCFFIQDQVFILKSHIDKLTDLNLEEFEKNLYQILKTYIQKNYLLIKRHYILFYLFSELVLEFSSKNYASIEKMHMAFKEKKIKDIFFLINDAYTDIVYDFPNIDVGKISNENSIRLDEKIKCTQEKISIAMAKKTERFRCG